MFTRVGEWHRQDPWRTRAILVVAIGALLVLAVALLQFRMNEAGILPVGVNQAGALALPQVAQGEILAPAKAPQVAVEVPAAEEAQVEAVAASVEEEVFAPSVGVRVDPFAGLPECPYTDTGSAQPPPLERVGDLWRFNPQSTGCAWIVEGRFPWQTQLTELSATLERMEIATPEGEGWPLFNIHHIVTGRSNLGAFDWTKYNRTVQELYGLTDDLLDDMLCLECSVGLYDPDWNMNDIATAKASIAEELEVKKLRDAMRLGNYLYPRVIWQPNGQMAVYYQKDSGDAAYEAFTGCTAGDEPQEIPVHGLWDGESFQAAIGAGHCTMAIYIDGASEAVVWDGYQKDGDEIVTYQDKVEAWIFPMDWTRQQVDAWVAAH